MFQSRKKCWSLFIFVFLMGPLYAQDVWMEKFLKARRSSIGSLKKYSTGELKKFLILDGKPKRASVSYGQLPLKKPALRNELKGKTHRVTTEKRKRPRSRKKKVLGNEELIAKARLSFENGKWETARRFYKLVLKSDPRSSEAFDRLIQIEKELR